MDILWTEFGSLSIDQIFMCRDLCGNPDVALTAAVEKSSEKSDEKSFSTRLFHCFERKKVARRATFLISLVDSSYAAGANSGAPSA